MAAASPTKERLQLVGRCAFIGKPRRQRFAQAMSRPRTASLLASLAKPVPERFLRHRLAPLSHDERQVSSRTSLQCLDQLRQHADNHRLPGFLGANDKRVAPNVLPTRADCITSTKASEVEQVEADSLAGANGPSVAKAVNLFVQPNRMTFGPWLRNPHVAR